jgi:dipeptidyl aminopeptidase/acylaminoacyl peptidase
MRFASLPTYFCVSVCLCASLAIGAKRPISHKDFDSWRSISGQTLSHDGHYLAYGIFPQEGDGEVIVRNLVTGKETHENAGQLPPPAPPDPNSEAPPAPRSIQLNFTNDSKSLVFITYPKKADLDAAKAAKAAIPAKGDLVIFDLAASNPVRVAGIKNFQLPQKGDGYVAYQKDDAPAAAPPNTGAADADMEDQARGGRGTRAGASGPARDFGSLLILRTLADKSERQFPDVLEYQMAKDGKTLVYSVASPKTETNGVFAVSTSGDAPRTLIAGKGKYQHLTFDDKVDQLAFIGNPAGTAFHLYLWKAGASKAEEIVSAATPGFHQGFELNERANLTFSKDGARLFFGAAPPAPPAHATAIDDDKPSFDLWNYKDDHIQPMQKVRAAQDRNRSFRAVYAIPEHKLFQLADEEMVDLVPSESGRYALGSDDREYRAMVEYGEHFADSYLVDTATGKRTLLAKKHQGAVLWSADGRYALTFDGKDWNTIAIPSGKTVNLTSKLPAKFWTEDNDTPSLPRAYGLAGWTKDGKHVLLYDRYDIWQVSPDGASAVNITDGLGRKEHVELRYVKLDPEEKSIDQSKPVMLRAEDTVTHASGFYTARVDVQQQPRKIAMAAQDFSVPIKAKDADVFLLTAQTFNQFPDLMVTDASMKEFRKVSDANPQKADLIWGSAEMVSFESLDGVPLQGVLYKPENFDAGKKYPMIVYIYEKLAQNVNHFVEPKPMDSINISYYVSNGYLVFTPDIVYTIGYPGQSALKCVLAGVNTVAARGFVDEKNIGIQGHSWGGYQIAYMVTQTNRFKAVEAGAPVANMISAYDGIRWGPGLPRQFQYEKTQSRIGGTIWEYPLRFIENSPIFMADRVQTPILMVHNDADDAVPWYQGIEYFLALRRLGKEAYLFTYNGEPHHLRRRANQKDYAIRLAQFFDFELKAGPKPAWMEKGIPYLHTPEQIATDH